MGAPGSGTPRDPPRHPQFTPRPRFATFAPRLGPFGSFCRDRPPVCSENDAFRTRNGDLNLGPESRRRSTGLQRNRFRPSPPASIRNFCSTSGPVWLRFWQRSTGLQRERCVSGAKRGPEFGERAPVCSENDARFRRRWNLHGNHRFAADRCLFTGCLFTGCLFTGCMFGVRIGIGIGIGKIGI